MHICEVGKSQQALKLQLEQNKQELPLAIKAGDVSVTIMNTT